MPKVQMSCPRCRQPILAEVEQLFDVGADPQAKQRFLSGQSNLAECKNCGYQGPLSLPIVYHDPEKELLLTYFPPELGMPVNEQERMMGPYITQVVNKLPPEKRKAYLFRPQTMLTMQTMIDRVLEADGITKEMIESSQKRLNLIQRLLTATPTARPEIVRQEEAVMDETFFQMFNRLVEASLASGDQASARAIAQLQQEMLPLTPVGQRLMAESNEVQAAVKALQEASQKGLTREPLLNLMLERNSDAALAALVSMTRNGLDYEFFTLLTERVNRSTPEEKQKLEALRQKLLDLTAEIDRRVKERVEAAHLLVNEVVDAVNVEETFQEHIEEIDEFFTEALREELESARQKGDLARSAKVQKVVELIQQASTPPAEFAFI
ncbi:MAG TPA: CpXC domain-containing protein [Anaerolinea sp.]|mgnify:CR=1 FL=1|nr:CpXC domain-containing protein [Anaerolinea sp.]